MTQGKNSGSGRVDGDSGSDGAGRNMTGHSRRLVGKRFEYKPQKMIRSAAYQSHICGLVDWEYFSASNPPTELGTFRQCCLCLQFSVPAFC